MKTGLQRIQDERARQIAVEGWSEAHDDSHKNGQLAFAAHCYENAALKHRLGYTDWYTTSSSWPWARVWWKPDGDPVRCLEKAGALYLAEGSRLARAGYAVGATERSVIDVQRCATLLNAMLKSLGMVEADSADPVVVDPARPLGFAEIVSRIGDEKLGIQRLGADWFQAREGKRDCTISFCTEKGTALAIEQGKMIGLVVWIQQADYDAMLAKRTVEKEQHNPILAKEGQ